MNILCLHGDVGIQPCKLHARKSMAQNEDSVVHSSIKRCTDIEEGDEADLVLIDGRKDSKYSCLGGMISAELGLIF